MGVGADEQDGAGAAGPAHRPSIPQEPHSPTRLGAQEVDRDLLRGRKRKVVLGPAPCSDGRPVKDLGPCAHLQFDPAVEGGELWRNAEAEVEPGPLETPERLWDPDPPVHLTRNRHALEAAAITGDARSRLRGGESPQEGALVEIDRLNSTGPHRRADGPLRCEQHAHAVDLHEGVGHAGEVEAPIGSPTLVLDDRPLGQRHDLTVPEESHGHLGPLQGS